MLKRTYEEVVKAAEKYGQGHLFDFIDELPIENSEKLMDQISKIDFQLMSELFNVARSDSSNKCEKDVEPIESCSLSSIDQSTLKKYYDVGMDAIIKGKVAAVTMAGGQGTRLGHDGPKGTFDIGLPSSKTLFQLQLERLMTLSQNCNLWTPWFIMTSEENHADTIHYFEANSFFGYPKEKIFFFQQGMLPLLGTDGKILLKEKDEIHFGPDGNGGVFLSLKQSGALDSMKQNGVEWVFFCGIDNALVKMIDPAFLGFTILSGKMAGGKSVLKNHPEERVGVFCMENNVPAIVEYTELPEKQKKATKENGELLFCEANIIAHLFRIDTLIRIADSGLPYHVALKSATYLDKSGQQQNPDMPNALKFESFIFDSFEFLDDMAVLRVEREKEFAPVKNRTGVDSPETARKLVMNANDS